MCIILQMISENERSLGKYCIVFVSDVISIWENLVLAYKLLIIENFKMYIFKWVPSKC